VWVPQSGLLEVCERVVNPNSACGNTFCSMFEGVAALDLQCVQVAAPFQVHSRHLQGALARMAVMAGMNAKLKVPHLMARVIVEK
jgi:hypothetical protein